MIKNGDLVYFKTAKRSTNRKQPEARFKGHGYAVMLGYLPLGAPEISAVDLLRRIGAVGFCSFDDIKEFLGDEALATLMDKITDKYYGKVIETEAELAAKQAEIIEERKNAAPLQEELDGEQKIVTPPALQLVDLRGQPMESQT